MPVATCGRLAKQMWLLGPAIALVLAACDATPRTPSESPSLNPGQQPASESSVPITTSTCPPTDQLTGPAAKAEQQAVGDGATLWALFFATLPIAAGTEVKVVWRMTGNGEFSMSATGPDGTVVKPVWGPERHVSSDWQRPGEEWGTGWVFPTPGCWTLNAMRTTGSGYLTVRVAG
jgi:hypothetical protein